MSPRSIAPAVAELVNPRPCWRRTRGPPTPTTAEPMGSPARPSASRTACFTVSASAVWSVIWPRCQPLRCRRRHARDSTAARPPAPSATTRTRRAARRPALPPMVISWPLPLLLARRAGRGSGSMARMRPSFVRSYSLRGSSWSRILSYCFQKQFHSSRGTDRARGSNKRLIAADRTPTRISCGRLTSTSTILRFVLAQRAQHVQHQHRPAGAAPRRRSLPARRSAAAGFAAPRPAPAESRPRHRSAWAGISPGCRNRRWRLRPRG